MADRLTEVARPSGYYDDTPAYLSEDGNPCQSRDCAGARIDGKGETVPAVVGFYLWADPETGHDKSGWATTFLLPDGRYVCEDCAIAIEEGESL